MSKKFQRKIENFICENCGKKVTGNGYTNHCPNCLWSKHVDNFPGDRKNKCHGKMKPVSVYQKNNNYYLIQQCQRCQTKKSIKLNPADNFNAVLKIAQSNQ